MNTFFQRVLNLLKEKWRKLVVVTIYQLTTYIFLCVLVFYDYFSQHYGEGCFKIFLMIYLCMTFPLYVMQYSPSIHRPTNSKDLGSVGVWIFAQVSNSA